MNNYKILGRIGQGAHGYVVKATNRKTKATVALKKINFKRVSKGEIPKNVMREITALTVLSSKYVVELLEVIPQGLGMVLVMEFLPMSLYDLLHNVDYRINQSEIKCYVKMILMGVKYLHENDIMHRDLKPANLLLDHKGKIKIADFGLARMYIANEPNRQYSHQVATRWYRAPELLYGSVKYTPAIDIWAVGCIMGELINRNPLFQGESDIEQLAIVLRTLGTPTKTTWPDLASLPDYNKIRFTRSRGVNWKDIVPDVDENTLDLIKSMVQYNHKARPTAKQALCHDYFFTLPDICPEEKMPKPANLKSCIPTVDELDELLRNFDEFDL